MAAAGLASLLARELPRPVSPVGGVEHLAKPITAAAGDGFCSRSIHPTVAHGISTLRRHTRQHPRNRGRQIRQNYNQRFHKNRPNRKSAGGLQQTLSFWLYRSPGRRSRPRLRSARPRLRVAGKGQLDRLAGQCLGLALEQHRGRSVARLREPRRRPAGLPDQPFSKGRPRTRRGGQAGHQPSSPLFITPRWRRASRV
jgi:hypothetical protein